MFFIYYFPLLQTIAMDSFFSSASNVLSSVSSALSTAQSLKDLSYRAYSMIQNKKQFPLLAEAILNAQSMKNNQILSAELYERAINLLNNHKTKHDSKDIIARVINLLSKEIFSNNTDTKNIKATKTLVQNILSLVEQEAKPVEQVVQYVYQDNVQSNIKDDINHKLKIENAEYKKKNIDLQEALEHANNKYQSLQNQKEHIVHVKNEEQDAIIQRQAQSMNELKNIINSVKEEKNMTEQAKSTLNNLLNERILSIDDTNRIIEKQQSEIENQKSEIENQKSEIENQKSEIEKLNVTITENQERLDLHTRMLPTVNTLGDILKTYIKPIMYYDASEERCALDYFKKANAESIFQALLPSYLHHNIKQSTKLEDIIMQHASFQKISEIRNLTELQNHIDLPKLLNDIMSHIQDKANITDITEDVKAKIKHDLTQLISDIIFYKNEMKKSAIQKDTLSKKISYRIFDTIIKAYMRMYNIIASNDVDDNGNDTISISSSLVGRGSAYNDIAIKTDKNAKKGLAQLHTFIASLYKD